MADGDDTSQESGFVCPLQTKGCEIESLGASQVGSLVLVLISIIFFLIRVRNDNDNVKLMLQVDYFALLVMTAIFFFVEESQIEEKYFFRLRRLRWPSALLPDAFFLWPLRGIFRSLAWAELAVRITIIVVFGIAASGAELSPLGLDSWSTGIFLMIVVYALFVLWDCLVLQGGGEDIVQGAILGDLIGAACTVLIFLFRETNPALCLILILVVFASILLNSKEALKAVARKVTIREGYR